MGDARVFQEQAEVAVGGQPTSARVFQEQVNVAITPPSSARVAQMVVEVAIPYVGPDPLFITAIASAEAFGSPTIIQGPPPDDEHTVEPFGINSGEAFGQPVITARIDPVGILSAEEFGEPLVTARIDPDPIVSQEEFGSPLILGHIAPDPIISREEIGEVAVFREATLSWFSVTGTTAGELFRAAYTLTHPTTVEATLTLADNRVLQLSDGNPLEVLLPADTPAGLATITALVDGETYTLGVPLTGTVIAPEEQPRPSPPPGRPRPKPRQPQRMTKHSQTRLAVRSSTRVRAVQDSRTTLPAWTSSAAVQPEIPVRTSTAIEMRTRTSVRSGRRRSSSAWPQPQSRVAVKRRDGRDVEALIVGLLD